MEKLLIINPEIEEYLKNKYPLIKKYLEDYSNTPLLEDARFYINSLKLMLPIEKPATYNQRKEYIEKFESEFYELLEECSP